MRFESSITFRDPVIARVAWLAAVQAVDAYGDHSGSAPLWSNVLAEAWRRRWFDGDRDQDPTKTFDDALYAAWTVSNAVGAPTDRLHVFVHEYTTCTGTCIYLNSDLKLSISGSKSDSVARRYAAAAKVAETEPAPEPEPEPEVEVIRRYYTEDADEFEGPAAELWEPTPSSPVLDEAPAPGVVQLSATVTRVVPL